MAKVGETIEHPVTGERITFLETAASSGGHLLKMAFEMRPRAFIAGAHAHPRQEERFAVGSGRIRVKMGRRSWIADEGDEISIPRGAGHTWGNPFDEPAQVVIELRPALRAETYFETYFGLARDGRVNARNGLPSLLQFALILHEYRDESSPHRRHSELSAQSSRRSCRRSLARADTALATGSTRTRTDPRGDDRVSGGEPTRLRLLPPTRASLH